jgi:methylated-DNA-protein-cysteine methyltransferase related protein
MASSERTRRPVRRRAAETPTPTRERAYPRIWAVVARIPRGRVATYGQVAALAGLPQAPRVAGYALHALPPGSPLPWHRVLAAGGRLSLGRLDPSGAVTQRLRLQHEGVRFDARGCVDLTRHQWPVAARAVAATRRRAASPAAASRRAPAARASRQG